jgi:hypothetical protein
MNRKLDALVRRVVFGPYTGPPTSDLDKYLFQRRYYALLFIPLLIGFVSALASGAPTPFWIVLGVVVALWLVTAVKLPFDIRRERRRSERSS